jgi:hypothetical protein
MRLKCSAVHQIILGQTCRIGLRAWEGQSGSDSSVQLSGKQHEVRVSGIIEHVRVVKLLVDSCGAERYRREGKKIVTRGLPISATVSVKMLA